MKSFKRLACFSMALATLGLAGCGGCGGEEAKNFTIRYADGNETYEVEVVKGEEYGITHYPVKTWYKFAGLFDKPEGGTQYVDKNGFSVGAYDEDKDMTLYAQFTPQEFTVTLDYQGGSSVTGGTTVDIAYGEKFTNLPTDVTAENKNFAGWYTKGNKGGVKVGEGTEFNDVNFNLYATTISLYAGYDVKQYQVTLCFGNEFADETLTVPHGTPLTELCYETRNERDEGVLSWSKTEGGKKYTGTITEATTLYATEWAPAIELDSAGGNILAPVVAYAGEDVVLPKPERELYKFMGWKDAGGAVATFTKMPAGGATLTAKWQGKLVYDTNGGTPIDDQSFAAGTAITLPIPTKTGYVLANWFDEDGEIYNSKVMPANGIKLKAGWYKAVMDDRVDKEDISSAVEKSKVTGPTTKYFWYRIPLTQYLGSSTEVTVRIDGQFKFADSSYGGGSGKPHTNIYSQNMVSRLSVMD